MIASANTDIQTGLLDFWTPCPGGHDGNRPPYPWPQGHACIGCADGRHQPHDECPDCQGSGKQFPLRLPCRYSKMVLTACPETCDDEGFHLHPKPVHQEDCTHCVNGFIFNPSADALWEAIRAKGWWGGIYQYGEPWNADSAEVYMFGENKGVGVVLASEGLRGQAAVETALARTKENW